MSLSLEETHAKFLKDIIEASKLYPHNVLSSIPSFLFLISTFALIRTQMHKYTDSRTLWTTKLWRNIVFHWMYFYVSKMWFLFLKTCRWALEYSDKAINKSSLRPDTVLYNKIMTHSSIFGIVMTIAAIPCLILFIWYLNLRDNDVDFIWINEDPYLRSEMGTSGHYLDRPVRGAISHNLEPSYRSGRSSSVDADVQFRPRAGVLRHVQSALSLMNSKYVDAY